MTCAIEAVAELGFANTSIRKIAERVGVAMSVVLYHFANKDELVRAIVTEAWRSAIATILPPVEAEPTAAGKLHAYIRANVTFVKTYRMQHMAMLDIGLSYRTAAGHRLDQLDIDPELLGDLAKLDLEAILRDGQATGEFRPMDTKSVAMALRGALNGAIFEIAGDPEYDALGYAEELVTLFDLATRRS